MINGYRNWLIARQYSFKTIENYLFRITRFLSENPNPFDCGLDDIQAYLIKVRDRGANTSTIEGYYAALKNFYDYLLVSKKNNLLIERNPLKALLPIKKQKRIPKFIPEDDLSIMLRAPDLKTLRGCRDYAIMLFLLHGLRADEIINLDMDRVFIDGQGFNRKLLIDIKGKGRKERRVVVEKSGDTEWAWNRFLGMRNGLKTNIAFPALLGKGKFKRMTSNGLYRMLKRYALRLGITKYHPHLWRHTAAVKMLEDGVPFKEIQYRLGHESVQTTDRYLTSATINQDRSSNSAWIHKLKKADARFRRWRR